MIYLYIYIDCQIFRILIELGPSEAEIRASDLLPKLSQRLTWCNHIHAPPILPVHALTQQCAIRSSPSLAASSVIFKRQHFIYQQSGTIILKLLIPVMQE